MLGKSEMMISHRDLFAADDLKQRIFVKQPRADAGLARGAFANGEPARPAGAEDDRAEPRRRARARPARRSVIVSRTGRLTFANLPARALFRISRDDSAGRSPSSRSPRSPVELRGPIEQALRERRRVAVGEVAFAPERGDAAPARRHASRRC